MEQPWTFAEENLDLLNTIIIKSQEQTQNAKSDLHTLFHNILNTAGNINDTTNLATIIISSEDESSAEDVNNEEKDINYPPLNSYSDDNLKLLLDHFENEGNNLLSNDEFFQIMTRDNLVDMFQYLAKQLSSEGLHKFCIYLTSMKNTENIDNIIRVFSIELLYPKFINSSINTSLEIGVMGIFKTYENIVCENLIGRLIIQKNPNFRVTLSLCDKLSSNNKLNTLNKLLCTCEKKLDDDQIELIQTLYVTDADNNLKHRLINLLYDFADTHSMSKVYGKLMITIFKSLGTEFTGVENSLRYIVSQNKSIYKRPAEKMLQNMLCK